MKPENICSEIEYTIVDIQTYIIFYYILILHVAWIAIVVPYYQS